MALLQFVLRNLLYETLKVDPLLDVNPRQRVLEGDAVVGCMDGADYFTRLRIVGVVLRRSDGGELPKPGEVHPVMAAFVRTCKSLGLPRNLGTQAIQEFHGAVLGGELDGIKGVLRVALEKAHGFVSRTCALFAEEQVTQVGCQHWSGLFCFAARFRRPLFSLLEEIFVFIVEFDSSKVNKRRMPESVRNEVLLAGLLAPMAFANLRAPLRKVISVSDASEQGGSAGEAVAFGNALCKKVAAKTTALVMTSLETMGEKQRQLRCTKSGRDAEWEIGVCALGCPSSFFSVRC